MLKTLFCTNKGFYLEQWDDNFIGFDKFNKWPSFVNGLFGYKLIERPEIARNRNFNCKLYEIEGYYV